MSGAAHPAPVPLAPSAPTGMNLDGSGRIAKICPEHRRVLERADTGDGLMCPAGDGPGGWHLVDAPLSIDRHTGKEVEGQPQRVDRPEEEDVAKPKNEKGNRCPGCDHPKVGRNARDGKPCARCRGGKVKAPAAARGAAPERAARAPRAKRAAAAAGAIAMMLIVEGPDLNHSEVLFSSRDPELLRRVGEVMTQWLTEGVEAGLRVAGQISKGATKR